MKKDLSGKMSDKELFEINSGEKISFDELMLRFEPLILSESAKLIRKNPDLRAEEDECRQEARLAFYKAAESYDPKKGVTFGLYAKICVHNRLVSYMRKYKSAKRRALESLEASSYPDENAKRKTGFAEEMLIASESEGRLKKLLDEEATPYEKKVFSLYLQKKTYAEIAAALGKSEKSVDNAIYRIKNKIKKRLF